jgi:hypothetical protein
MPNLSKIYRKTIKIIDLAMFAGGMVLAGD